MLLPSAAVLFCISAAYCESSRVSGANNWPSVQNSGNIVPIGYEKALNGRSQLDFFNEANADSQVTISAPNESLDQLVELEGYGLDNDYISLTESHALILDNSVDIYLPEDVANHINGLLGAKQQGLRNVVNCSATSTLPREFFLYLSSIGITTRITLKHPDYLIQVGGHCLSPFNGVIFGPPGTVRQFWMIGTFFVHLFEQGRTGTLPGGTRAEYLPPTPSPLAQTTPGPEYVELRAFTFGNKRVDLDQTIASIEPRLVDIIVPTEQAQALNNELGATQQPEGILWTINCDDVPNLPEFSLHLYRYGSELTRTLKGSEYILRAGGNCISPFVGIDFGSEPGVPAPTWFVGDVYLGL